MPFQKKPNFNIPYDGPNNFILARGLEEFSRALEKDFFAKVSVQCRYDTERNIANLMVDIRCNYGLVECLHYFNNVNWGGLTKKSDSYSFPSPFDITYEKLSDANKGAVDIAEMSLYFTDTSIVISSIYDQSIPEQLNTIFHTISKHFVCVTKGHTDMPYEVFVPVFENSPSKQLDDETSYFNYWGLYFDDGVKHNAMVYNLKTKKLFEQDFFLLD